MSDQGEGQPAVEEPRALLAVEEPRALLAAYLDAPLPYTFNDWERVTCPSCNQNKKYHCPTCLRFLGAPPNTTPPQLALPLRIDMVLADYRKKSTGIQAATIAPGSIHVHAFPDAIPMEWDPQRTLVIYPADDAVTLDALPPEELAGIERLVLLDCRWNNTTRVLEHAAVKRLTRKVKLAAPPPESAFWRYHSKGDGHLSTVEALYCVLKEYEALTGKHATWLPSPASPASLGTDDGSGRGGEPAPLEELFYIFRLLRLAIKGRYQGDMAGLPAPMEEAGKERMRQLRWAQGQKSKLAKKRRIEERRRQREEQRQQAHKQQEEEGQQQQAPPADKAMTSSHETQQPQEDEGTQERPM